MGSEHLFKDALSICAVLDAVVFWLLLAATIAVLCVWAVSMLR